MINLLSPEAKSEIRAARINILLVRYLLLLIAAGVFLIASLGVAFYYLQTIRTNAESTITENTEKEGTYSNVRSNTDSFNSSISDAKTVLEGQVNYSQIFLNIARTMPDGSALKSLKLDKGSLSSPITLSVKLADERAARDILSNFKKASFVTNVTKGSVGLTSDSAYPYSMDLSITLDKEKAQK